MFFFIYSLFYIFLLQIHEKTIGPSPGTYVRQSHIIKKDFFLHILRGI